MIRLKEIESGQGTNSYSFSLQYTSLMLIVLCFVIGAFTQERIKTFTPKVQVQVEDKPTVEALVFESLFEEGKTNFALGSLEALDLILASHDLEIELHISETEKGIVNSELAIARAVALHKHFESVGVPPKAMNISTVAALEKGQVQFTLTKEIEEGVGHG